MLAAVVQGTPQGLEDRALPRFKARCTFEDDRRLGVVTLPRERLTALQELVGRLVLQRRIAQVPGPIVGRL